MHILINHIFTIYTGLAESLQILMNYQLTQDLKIKR